VTKKRKKWDDIFTNDLNQNFLMSAYKQCETADAQFIARGLWRHFCLFSGKTPKHPSSLLFSFFLLFFGIDQ